VPGSSHEPQVKVWNFHTSILFSQFYVIFSKNIYAVLLVNYETSVINAHMFNIGF